MIKILPTPKRFIQSENTASLSISEIITKIERDETVECGINAVLAKSIEGAENKPSLILEYSKDEFFKEKNAEEQGYILVGNRELIRLCAKSSIGFLYGLMTLSQLMEKAPSEFEIYDAPAIRFRGNMNTLWAESSVWSYDFGDGLEGAERRLYMAIDDMMRAKLNLMYADAFGFASGRFDGYDEFMMRISKYAKVRGVRLMVGGYGMGYGMSACYPFMGKVFRNRYPYPDGELYDCIGTCERDNPDMPISRVQGRSYGTCLSNDGLTDDKIAEIKDYLLKTGVSVIYLHNMDADEIHEPLWLARCERCRAKYPSDDLYAKDGLAGAFADFYDRMLDSLLVDVPDLIICAISPGYAYHTSTKDKNFEKCRKFWSCVMKYMRNKKGLLPSFRELFVQKTEERYRFDMLDEVLDSYGCAFFSGGDGFYSDKCYTPSAAYVSAMKNSELIICANGSALQKPTQYANAEYLWNPTNSAFYNVELCYGYDKFTKQYDDLREGIIRPTGIYGTDGLLEASCNLLFGKSCGKRVADVFRLRGRNNEAPIFTVCNVEIFTNHNKYNLPFNWDTQISKDEQIKYRERFSESALVTESARDILFEIISSNEIDEPAREHLSFLAYSAKICANLTRLLTRYMDLYIEADKYFSENIAYNGDICERATAISDEADLLLAEFEREGLKPFDIYGGIFTRREEVFEFVSYSAKQIVKSIKTN